jgi:hypothetical protein
MGARDVLYRLLHSNEGAASLQFSNDGAAIAYALRTAQGGAVEVWRGLKLIATIDERALCDEQLAA